MLKLINDELIPFKETFTHNEQRENIFYQKNSRDNGQAIKKFVIFR